MRKLVIIIAVGLLLLAGPACASPLDDFAPGRWAFDVNFKPHAYQGGDAFDFAITAGLGRGWAVAGRHIAFDAAGPHGAYRVSSNEFNLIRKISPGLQLYAGHSRTDGDAGHKNVLQAGVIAAKKLDDRITLYTILGGGRDVANIEFGLSYRLRPDLELTATYRHLTVENVGPARAKENFRGFGLGFTWKI
jgi:hypothetical protein